MNQTPEAPRVVISSKDDLCIWLDAASGSEGVHDLETLADIVSSDAHNFGCRYGEDWGPSLGDDFEFDGYDGYLDPHDTGPSDYQDRQAERAMMGL